MGFTIFPQIIGNKVIPKAYTAWKKPIAVDFDSCGTYFIASLVRYENKIHVAIPGKICKTKII